METDYPTAAAYLGNRERSFGEAAGTLTDRRNLHAIIGEVEAHVAHARQLASRAYMIGDAVFGPVPQGVEGNTAEGPATLESLVRKLGAALSEIDSALNRL